MNDKSIYRAEIDGLRAIAVLAVVVFHFFPEVLPGGFIGVDIFFVISGYLITKIIYREIENDCFSFKKFYLRRIKRILPAYIAVCLATFAAAWIMLIPGDFEYFSTSLATSWLFCSNLFFSMLSGGYFDNTSHHLLLHTWSLSVEEQFYLIFPLILLVLHRYARRYILVIFLLLIFLSTFISKLDIHKNSLFYLLQFRFFELLIGASINFFGQLKKPPFWSANTLSFTGAISILVSLFLFNKNTSWPGINALLPCFGTALLIYSSNSSPVYWLLRRRPIVFIGLISYSLYLWHWPIYTIFQLLRLPPLVLNKIVAIALSVLLAYLSWQFIEKPLRSSQMKFKAAFLLLYFIPVVIFSCIGLFSLITDGYPQRFSLEIQTLMKSYSFEKDMGRHCSTRSGEIAKINFSTLNSKCSFGVPDKTSPEILLFGDSHANHIRPFLEELALDADLKGVYHVEGSCSAINIQTQTSNSTSCKKNNSALYEIDHNFKYFVLASAWNYKNKAQEFKADLTRAIQIILNRKAVPVIFKDTPAAAEDISRCIVDKKMGRIQEDSSCGIPIDFVIANHKEMDAIIDEVAANFPSVIAIDPKSVLCGESECLTHDDKIAFYRDNNHLNPAAAKILGRVYLEKNGNPFKKKNSRSPAPSKSV